MARTISEIYESIVTGVNSDPNLPDATTSMVGKWRIIAGIIAIAIYLHESLWDAFKVDMEAFAEDSIPGTIRWYHAQSLAFQYGDDLTYIGLMFVYAVPDVTKQIVTRCAVSEVGGQVRIKISKMYGGVPQPLTIDEEKAFSTYINLVKFAGTNLAIINYYPDQINIIMDVIYNAMLLNPDGSLITDNSVFPVEDAINAYVAGIIYGGVWNRTKQIDAIQNAVGVVDPILTYVEAKANNASIYDEVDQNYTFIAGYAILNDITINYIANV